ncbi:MAG: class I SAM-dependent methyltransferase, partial [Oscillospiraceae bacterium]|nr:class I SAM-dependent methyltransferase [Oscillospiraceae bacterium]
MEQFGDYAYYYNAFYKDKDYAKEASDVDTLLKKYGHDVKDVLVYGCGTGSHDAELVKLGYHLHGIDMSPQMIEEARKRAAAQNLVIDYDVADIRTYEPHRKYDAVVSLFHVMSYQTRNEDIKNALTSARKALNKGGILLFDCWYGPGVLTDPPAVRIKEVEDDDYRLIRLCKPELFDKRDAVDV